jgi:hypothetical protein
LMDFPEVRKNIGMTGRKNVETHYSIDVTAPLYLNILRSVIRE